MGGGDREAKRIELFWYFVLLHHLRTNAECQVYNVLYVNEARRFLVHWRIADPIDSLLILAQEHFALYKFLGASAYLQESIALDQLLTDFYSLSDVGDS